MIDIRKLKELVKLMVNNDLTELDLRDSEEQVSIQRPNQWSSPQVHAGPVAQAPAPVAVAAPPAAAVPTPAPAEGASASGDDRAGLVAIECPMVGTFYSAASPDAPPFISVGDTVAADSVVCIIEAMKIFNEIKSEQSGVVEKILVQNGDAVEFGQELMLVRPA